MTAAGVRTPVAAALAAVLAASAGARLPAQGQAMQFTRIGTIEGPADLVRVEGERAYVAAGKTLTSYDISSPEAPRKTGSHTFPEKVWGFQTAGRLLYVAADFFGLGVLDASGPSGPTLVGSLKTPGQAKNIAIYGDKLLVADHMSGLDYLDVSDPANPVNLGSYFLDGYARDVVAVGSMAYAVDAPNGLYVLDLARADPLEPVGTVQSATAPGFITMSDESVSPRLACLIGVGALQIYDVSNPAEPVRVSTLRTPGRAQRATLRGTLAYVADGSGGLQVVDLSAPESPTIVAAFPTPEPARDVAVAGPLVFLVVGSGEEGGEVLILRQSGEATR